MTVQGFSPQDELYIGDRDGGNYAALKSDGELNLHGTARVEVSAWISAEGIKAPGDNPASWVKHGLAGAWSFADQGVEANQEQVSGIIKVPENMDRTVAPSLCVGWSADGISPGVCEWELEYVYTSENEDTTVGAQETLSANEAASSTSNGMVITYFTGVDLPSATDICIHIRFTRLSAGGTDTIADTVELHGMAMTYTVDKLGTAT